MELHAVDAEIVPPICGMLRVDESKRDEGTAIAGPAGEDGELSQPRLAIDYLGHGSRGSVLDSHAQQPAGDVAGSPELLQRHRNDALRQLHEPAQKPLWLRSQGQLHAAPSAETSG